jgi:hypothetical protein
MPQMLSSDMARKSLSVLSERVEQGQNLSRYEARDMVSGCEFFLVQIEQIWQVVQRLIDDGIERRVLGFLVKELIGIAEMSANTFRSAVARISAAPGLSSAETANNLSALEVYSRRLTQIHSDAQSLLKFAEAPHRQIDPSSLPAGTGEIGSEGYINLKDWSAGPREHGGT